MVSIDAAVGAVLALIHRWNLAQFLYNWQTLIAGALGSGLIDQSQKRTAAAMQIAEK